MDKYTSIPFNTLFHEYVSLYLKEFGNKKAKDIVEKVNHSNKCNRFLHSAELSRSRPEKDDFIVTVLSSSSFLFGKAETVCYASLLLMFRWHINTGLPKNVAYEPYLNNSFFYIIEKCRKFKTHITSNDDFFEDFYRHLLNVKEDEKSIEGIQSSIFPGGNSQIGREIHEVMALLSFKYAEKDVENTYIHAAATYYIATDKSPENIVNLILLNEQSVVNNQEAMLLYDFLQKKYLNHSSTTSIPPVEKQISLSDQILLIATGGINELKTNYKELIHRGEFEVIIFNTLVCINAYYNVHPTKILDTKDHLFTALIKQAKIYGFNVPDDTLIEFIQGRFAFYTEELTMMSNREGYLPGKIFSTFYINPLSTPVDNFDVGEIIKFLLAFKIMLIWVQNRTNEVILLD